MRCSTVARRGRPPSRRALMVGDQIVSELDCGFRETIIVEYIESAILVDLLNCARVPRGLRLARFAFGALHIE